MRPTWRRCVSSPATPTLPCTRWAPATRVARCGCVTFPELRHHRGRGHDQHRRGREIAELAVNPLVRRAWPGLVDALELFGSPAIRNAATVGGNLANASSVADLAVLLLALDANVHLDGPEGRRVLPLTQFHLDYKRTALRPHELIVAVNVPANRDGTARLHFEKVARRAHDDIATVCSAMLVAATTTRLSAGGVGPVPLLLSEPNSDLAALPGRSARSMTCAAQPTTAPACYSAQVLAHLAALDADFDPLRRLP